MRNSFAHLGWIIAVVLTLALPTAAQADPIVITGGSISLVDPSTNLIFSGFTLTGMDSTFRGVVVSNGAGGVSTGRTATLSHDVFLQNDFPFQHATGEVVNGTVYSVFFSNSILSFTGEPFLVPPPPSDQFAFSFSTPFTMTGHIAGSATPGSPLLFSVDVTGSGRATIGGRIVNAGTPERSYLTQSLTYVFESSPAPTPEPATLFLVGSAVVGAFWRRARPS